MVLPKDRQAGIRTEDTACREGGEKMVINLPGANIENTPLCAEALREGVKAIRVAHNGKALGPVTISLGIAACPGRGTRGLHLIGG